MLLNEEESSQYSKKKNAKKISKKKSKKFFTDLNSTLKCSCYKTQCDKKYCECFNNGRYCINCNCQNCLNKRPINSSSDMRPKIIESFNNKKKIFCTCTKSGCKLKYCECYKNGIECNELCRCSVCKNTKIKKINNKNFSELKICYLNSICIIDNLLKEDLKRNPLKKNFLNKKRKKNENKENINNEDDKDDPDGKLFDKNGNIILTHITLSEIKKLYSHYFN